MRGLAAFALLALGAGCHGASTAPAVAAVAVVATKSRVAIGAPIDLAFKFDVLQGAAINGNFRVFVHVLAPDGQVLWNDDHEPPVPTSQWKPGQTVQYVRTSFVPAMAHADTVTVEVGLYRDNERLPLQTAGASENANTARSYKVATLQLAPQADNIFLIYKSGWYPQEFSSTDPAVGWTWTGKSAVIDFKNPHTDTTLYIELAGRPDAFKGTPQTVTVVANGQPVGSFQADSNDAVLHRLPIPALSLGAAEMAEIRVDVDRTFTPAALGGGDKDERELGIRVYHLFLESR